MIKLYHYVHCPFCVRVRMALCHLNIPYESIVLPYDDESTPLSLTGVKMLPIISLDNKAMNESLDIIARIDSDNRLKNDILNNARFSEEIEQLLAEVGKNVHSLAMPYWIYTKEFNIQSRQYFQSKKEKKRGPFEDLMKEAEVYKKRLEKTLVDLESKLNPFYTGDQFNISDIMIASHLWGLYVVPEFQFSSKLHSYLQEIKKITNFNYHEDFWRILPKG